MPIARTAATASITLPGPTGSPAARKARAKCIKLASSDPPASDDAGLEADEAIDAAMSWPELFRPSTSGELSGFVDDRVTPGHEGELRHRLKLWLPWRPRS